MKPPRIGIPCPRAATERGLAPYIRCLEAAGGEAVVLRAGTAADPEEIADTLSGLYLIAGADVHPSYYGEAPDPQAGLFLDEERDALEIPLVRAALERDLPILGICRGMQVLNVALGGKLAQDIPGHRTAGGESAFHPIFILPSTKLAQITGLFGMVDVNSRHHQGARMENKAPRLLAAAQRPDDGIIEALESDEHRFVLGVQFHPQRAEEVAEGFQGLFRALVGAAGGRILGRQSEPT